MAALKWIVVVVFGLGGLGALGMGVLEGGAKGGMPQATLPPLALRAFPPVPGVVAQAPAAAPAEPEKAPEEPVKPPEPVAKAPEPVAKTPEPVAKTAEPVAKAAEPVAKVPEPEKAREPEKAPEPAAKAPPKAPPPAAAPAGEGTLNLRASDTADVYVDGKKVGGSPVMGFKAKVGTRRVRFDCYDAAGNAIAGPVKTVTVKVDEEQDVEFTCPDAE